MGKGGRVTKRQFDKGDRMGIVCLIRKGKTQTQNFIDKYDDYKSSTDDAVLKISFIIITIEFYGWKA